MHRPAVLAALAALSAVLAVSGMVACAPTPAGTVTLPAATGAGPTTTSATPARPDGSAAHPLPWGATYTGQGVAITLAAPVTYHPSDSAFVDKPTGRDVTVKVAVANKGTDSFSPLTDLSVDGTAGSTAVQDVEDDANGVGSPSAQILPGHSLSWRQGFGVPTSAHDLTVSLTIGFTGSAIYYAGSI
jgi:hypothetical protein